MLPSMGSQRIRHDLASEQQQQRLATRLKKKSIRRISKDTGSPEINTKY